MSGRTRDLTAVAAYLAITLIYAWPLPSMLSTAVAHDPYDPALNAWILWWTTHAVPLTARWWNAPVFVPAPGVLAFSEHLLGLAPLAAPVTALTHSALAGYNVALLASFVLSAAGAYWLALILTGQRGPAFVAGLLYAFAPYRLAHLAHIQVLSSYWIPVCLASLHHYSRTSAPKWAIAAAAAWLMQSYANGYYLFFSAVLIALWILWHAPGRWSRRQAVGLVPPFAVAGILILPVLMGYLRILQGIYGFSRAIGEIRMFSADVAGLLFATNESLLWSWVHLTDRPESNLFPGLTIVVLVVLALVQAHPFAGATGDVVRIRRWRIAVGAVAVLAAAGAAVPLTIGSWRLHVGGVRLLSIARGDKPASVALVAALVWIALLPQTRRAWRRRSPLGFYLAAALAMWLFALGPDPTILDRRALYQAPYGWLMRLPAFSGLRVPARFWMLALACLAPIGAIALSRVSARWRTTIVVVASIGILADGWPREFLVVRAQEARPSPPGIMLRLDLPMGDGDAMAMYQQTQHRTPLANGYSGYAPPHYYALEQLTQAHDSRVLAALSADGPLGIVIDHAQDGDGALRKWVVSAGARTVTTMTTWSSYVVDRSRASAPADMHGATLPLQAVDSYPSPPHAIRATDGDLITRWSGGVQQQSAGYSIDLGTPSRVEQLVLLLGAFVTDFPRRLRVEVSADGQQWQTAFLDDTALLAYYGALRHPREMPLVIPIARDGVRYIRLAQLGFGTHDWSIAEVRVLR